MRLTQRLVALVLLITVVILPAIPAPAQAQIPVTDVGVIAEQVVQYIQMIVDYLEQLQHYYMLVKQYQWMLHNLDNLQNPLYFQLFGWWGHLLEVIQLGKSIGYSLYNLQQVFDSHFPGATATIPRNLPWQTPYIERVDSTKDTLRATLLATQRVANLAHTFEANVNAFNDASKGAEGNRQVSQVTHEYLGQLSEQLTAMIQLQAAALNAQNVMMARSLQEEADERLGLITWMRAYEPNPYAVTSRGSTGIPGYGLSGPAFLP